MFHFYNTFFNLFNISSSGITISSTGSCFSISTLLDLVTASAISFPINSSVLWATFLEAGLTASSSVSNNCFFVFSHK